MVHGDPCGLVDLRFSGQKNLAPGLWVRSWGSAGGLPGSGPAWRMWSNGVFRNGGLSDGLGERDESPGAFVRKREPTDSRAVSIPVMEILQGLMCGCHRAIDIFSLNKIGTLKQP